MPRIPDQWLDLVVYLYASAPDAEAGVRTGGSGFLLDMPCESIPDARHVLAVSNRHVVESGASVVRLNTKEDRWDVLDLTERDWFYHPDGDDLAVSILSLDGAIYKYLTCGIEQLLTRDAVYKYDMGIGDEVYVVGRFINHEGKQRNLPTARFGNIAQMPYEPIKKRRENIDILQESFLIEAKSIGGYSGSPVIIDAPLGQGRADDTGAISNPGGVWLLGVDWGHLNDWRPVCDANGNPLPQGMRVALNSGMMTVVPAWRLAEMLEGPVLRDRLRQVESQMAAELGPPDASADHAGSDDGGADADWLDPAEAARRRDETLRRMLSTPPRPGKGGKPPAS